MKVSSINFDSCWKLFGSFRSIWIVHTEDALLITHDLLEFAILGYIPQSRKSEKLIKIAEDDKVFRKDFVDITYENASFSKQEAYIWLQLIYFLNTIAFWFVKCFFSNAL